MRIFGSTIILAAICMSPAAICNEWHKHELRARAEEAGRALVFEYIRTPNEQLKIVSAYAQTDGTICVEFVDQGGDPATIEYDGAVFHNDRRRTFLYGIDEDEFNESCSDDGTNLLPEVERGVAKGAQ